MQAELPPGTRQTIQQHGGLSSDTRAMMLFEANKKTALVAYILWFFLGLFGGHNFYLKRTGVAVAQLILTLTIVGMLSVRMSCATATDRKSTRLNSSHQIISYAVFCLKKKNTRS